MKTENKFFIIFIYILIVSCSNIPKDDLFKEYLYIKTHKNFEGTTINEDIQKDVSLVLKNHKVPYGVVIISDVRNGRILAIDEYSQRGYEFGKYINKPLQAASIFKIVTFFASLNSNVYNSKDTIKYYDRMYSELRNYLVKRRSTKIYNKTTVKDAMAFSNNSAFAEISLRLKKEKIIDSAEKLFFTNEKIRGIKTGYIEIPEDSNSLIKLASGLDYSYMSPLHALLIIMAVGNDGKLVLPYINKGDTKKIINVMNNHLANEILNSLSMTTKIGTARKQFSKDPEIASKTYAKTGSLCASDPDGYYNWFVGIYDGKRSRYGIVVLTVNDPEWSVKANYVAFKAIEFIKKYEED
ncbi:MAG: penicillin-binding transpeptidase domain-containing protein [candidate division WOR-3 bacterium]